MVEFAVCLPIIVLIFTGIVFFGRGFVIGQRAGMAARYAAWRFAKKTDTAEADVKSTVRNIFGVQYELSKKKTQLGGGFSNVIGLITSAGGGLKTSISFKYEPKYIAFNPGAINIGHSVVVDGGTWCFEEVGSDNLFGVIIDAMLDKLGAVGQKLADAIGGAKDGKGSSLTKPPDSTSPSDDPAKPEDI